MFIMMIRTLMFPSEWVEIAIDAVGSRKASHSLITVQVLIKKFNNIFSIYFLFFTTKPVGKGTGMGMSIRDQIVTESTEASLNDSLNLEKNVSDPNSSPTERDVKILKITWAAKKHSELPN